MAPRSFGTGLGTPLPWRELSPKDYTEKGSSGGRMAASVNLQCSKGRTQKGAAPKRRRFFKSVSGMNVYPSKAAKIPSLRRWHPFFEHPNTFPSIESPFKCTYGLGYSLYPSVELVNLLARSIEKGWRIVEWTNWSSSLWLQNVQICSLTFLCPSHWGKSSEKPPPHPIQKYNEINQPCNSPL